MYTDIFHVMQLHGVGTGEASILHPTSTSHPSGIPMGHPPMPRQSGMLSEELSKQEPVLAERSRATHDVQHSHQPFAFHELEDRPPQAGPTLPSPLETYACELVNAGYLDALLGLPPPAQAHVAHDMEPIEGVMSSRSVASCSGGPMVEASSAVWNGVSLPNPLPVPAQRPRRPLPNASHVAQGTIPTASSRQGPVRGPSMGSLSTRGTMNIPSGSCSELPIQDLSVASCYTSAPILTSSSAGTPDDAAMIDLLNTNPAFGSDALRLPVLPDVPGGLESVDRLVAHIPLGLSLPHTYIVSTPWGWG